MRMDIRHAFIGSTGHLREGWFAALFLVGLFAILAPLLIWSEQAGREISVAEQTIIILLVTWACQWLRKKRLSDAVGQFDARWPVEFGAGALIGAVLMLVPAILLLLIGAVRWGPAATPASLIWSGMLGMLIVAIAEELLFRGFLFQRLLGAIGVWPAQLLIAGFFLLTHLGNPGLQGTTKIWAATNIFMASLLFGFAYLRTRSLAMPVGIHFAANSVQGPVLGMAVSGNEAASALTPSFASSSAWLTGGTFGLEGSLPGLACVLTALVLLAVTGRKESTGRERTSVKATKQPLSGT